MSSLPKSASVVDPVPGGAPATMAVRLGMGSFPYYSERGVPRPPQLGVWAAQLGRKGSRLAVDFAASISKRRVPRLLTCTGQVR